MCTLLSTMLATKNVQPVCVHSLAEATAYLKTGPLPAVVFLDYRLPDGNGLDYLSFIKATDKKIKVIMITGSDEDELSKEATRLGCFAFLEKPFSYLKVAELLEKALKKRKLPFGLS